MFYYLFLLFAMKIFCFSFIFYLLVLSWQPCSDLTKKILSGEANSNIQTKHLQDTETPDERDECSPFCICSCCHISTAHANLNFTVTSAFVASFENAPDISYKNPYSFQNPDSIWQPPKVDFTV